MRPLLLILVLLVPAAAAQPLGTNVPDPVAAAEHLVEAQRTDEAVALLEQALHDDGRDARAHHLLAVIYGADGALHDDGRARRHAERAIRADPDNPRYLETRLAQLQRELAEERAFSLVDTRRPALARRILALDPTSAIALEERALGAFLEFEWRRSLVQRRGGWDPAAERGQSGAANRALRRALDHVRHAIEAEPSRATAHRLHLRILASAGDWDAFLPAARAMAEARPSDPDARLYLGAAAFEAHRLDEAEAHFAQALAMMAPETRHAFEDRSLLARADAPATDSAAFWAALDPRLLSPQNERQLEHYARLTLADLLFGDAFGRWRGWETVRGEVAVRYGRPLADLTWLSQDFEARDFGRYTRWDYGDFTLLFEDAFRAGDYELWSSAEGEDEVTRARNLFRRMPERSQYAPPVRVDFPFAAATFLGEDGQTDVVVRHGVPVEEPGQRLTLDAGAFLLDGAGRIVAERRQRVERARPEALHSFREGTLWTDGFALSAPPGAYTLAVEFEQAGTGAAGYRRAPVELPDYEAGDLAISDLLLAYGAEEAEGAAPLVRRGFAIDPAPWGVFAAAQPIYLYFETYHLALTDGRGRYAVEVALIPNDPPKGLAGLARRVFGGRERGVAVAFEGEASADAFGEVVILDASEQAPGPYLLTLRLRDLATGASVERTVDLLLE